MRREREMKLLAHEKHRHRVFTKQRVDTLDNYMSAAQKQEQAAERSGNRVAADVERKRIEKANAAKMVEMRQRQKAAREEREVAEKYRALMEQEEREVQEAEEATLQALMNQVSFTCSRACVVPFISLSSPLQFYTAVLFFCIVWSRSDCSPGSVALSKGCLRWLCAAGARSQVAGRRRSARVNSAAASARITGNVRVEPDPFPAILADASD